MTVRLRRSLALLTVAVVALGPVACGDDGGTDDPNGAATSHDITLATAVPQQTVFMLPFAVAEDIGAWERRGLDVEVINFPEPPRLHEAIAAGDVDFVADSAAGALPAIHAGQEMRMVSAGMNSVAGFGVVASNDVEDIDDLAGRTMGITGPNSATDLLTQLISEQVTGDPQGIERQPLGGFDAQTAALARGDIDGFVWSFDGIASVEEEDLGHQVADLAELFPEFLYFGLLTSPDTIDSDSEVVTLMIEGLVEAFGRIRNDREYAIDQLVDLTEFSPEIAESIWESTHDAFSPDGAFEEAGVVAVEDALVSTGVLPEKLAREDWLDESFVPVTVDEG